MRQVPIYLPTYLSRRHSIKMLSRERLGREVDTRRRGDPERESEKGGGPRRMRAGELFEEEAGERY